jgi:TP901 family phage tail tape measure protein
MSEVDANIRINIETAKAQAQLRALQTQVAALNKSMSGTSMAQMGAAGSGLVAAGAGLKGYNNEIVTMASNAKLLDKSLAGASRGIKESFVTMGQAVRGTGTAMDLATQRAEALHTQYSSLGKSVNGLQTVVKSTPLQSMATNAQVAAQRMIIFNRALNQGTTSLLNFGKNLQWAGRQLMVGFTVPLTILGGIAAKTFMDLERQIINFKRVYGDFDTLTSDTEAMTEAIQEQAIGFAKWGITVRDSIELAASAAATGLTGDDLLVTTEQATKLATLGMITQEQALDTMISLNSAFKIQGQELEDTVNFLNAVENQTVLALSDVTEAIPLVAPVIKGLGGDVQDLAVMLTAMREGGIGANEAANALKTSLARLVTPAKAARDRAEELGINLKAIVEDNEGDLMGMIMDLSRAMQGLGDLQKQQLLSDLFGKRQFARMGALFTNIADEASQAQRVIDLTASSTAELAALADKELKAIEESAGMRFTAAVEQLKVAIAPIGEFFLKVLTPIIEFGTKVANKFNELSDTAKTVIGALAVGLGAVLPVLVMGIGLFTNLVAMIGKGVAQFLKFLPVVRQTAGNLEYMSMEQQQAALAAEQLSTSEMELSSVMATQAGIVGNLTTQYNNLAAAMGRVPRGVGGMPTSPAGPAPVKMATGGNVPGTGNTDKIPALLTPGEFVVKKDQANKHRGFLTALNSGVVKGFNQGGSVQVGSKTVPINFKVSGADTEKLQKKIQKALEWGVESADIERIIATSVEQGVAQGMTSAQGTKEITESMAKEMGREGLASRPKYKKDGTLNLEKSHVMDPIAFSTKEIEDYATSIRESGDSATKAGRAQMELIDAVGASNVKVEQLGDAVLDLPSAVNQSLKGGGQMSGKMAKTALLDPDVLANTFNTQKEQWANYATEMNLSQQEIDSGFAQIDAAQSEYEQHVRNIADDAVVVEQATKDLGENTVSLNGVYEKATENTKGAFKEFQNEIKKGGRNIRLSLTEEGKRIAKAKGMATASDGQFQTSSGKIDTRRTSRSAGVTPNRGRVGRSAAITDYQTVSMTQRGKAAADAYYAGIQQGLEGKDPYLSARDRSSPHPLAAIDGADDAEAYEAARRAALEGSDPYTDARGAKQAGGLAASPNQSNQRLAALQNQRVATTQQAIVADQKVVAASNRQVAAQSRFTVITNAATKAMQKVAVSAKTFGAALKNGSMKLSAGVGAATGAVFAMSMVEGPMQELAQQIMPATFALMALQQLAPLLMNPVGLMIAAVVAVGAGMWYLNKKTKEAAQAAQDFAINSQGSAKALKNFAEGLGKVDPQTEWAKVTAGVTKEQEESFGKAMDFVESESGQEMVKRAKSLSGSAQVEAMLSELRLAISTGLIDTQTAQSIAQALGAELKDPALGRALVQGVTDFASATNNNVYRKQKAGIEDVTNALNVQIGTLEDQIDVQKEYTKERGNATSADRDLAAELDALLEVEKQANEESAKTGQNIDANNYKTVLLAKGTGILFNNTQKLAQIQAAANIAFREGALSLAEYDEIVSSAAQQQDKLNDLLSEMSDSEFAGFEEFAENAERAAQALGMPQEEIDKVKTQVSSLQKILQDSKDFTGPQAGKIGSELLNSGLTGQLTSGEIAGALDVLTSGKQEYEVYVKAIQENPEEATEILQLIYALEKLPPEIKQKYQVENAEDLEKISEDIDKITVATSYFATNAKLSGEAFDAIMSGAFTTEQVSAAEDFFNAINNGLDGALNGYDLEQITQLEEWFDGNDLEKKAKFSFAANGEETNLGTYLKNMGINWKEFEALPDIQKRLVVIASMNLDRALAQLNAFENKMKDMGVYYSSGAHYGLQMNVDSAESELEGLFDPNPADKPIGSSGGSGGGSEESNWLDQLIADTKENTELYRKARDAEGKKIKEKQGWIEYLRENTNLSEEAVQELARDDSAREEFYKMSKKEQKQVAKKDRKRKRDEGFGSFESGTEQIKEDAAAANRLMNQGVTPEVMEFIKSEEDLWDAVVNGGANAAKKAKEAAEERMAANDELERSLDPMKFVAKKAKEFYDEITKTLQNERVLIEQDVEVELNIDDEALRRENETLQKEIAWKTMQHIEPLETKIELQEDLIEDIEREITALERGMEVYEDQVDAKEKQIEQMQRADELRMRESEYLDHDLKLMSWREEEINETYNKRIEALSKVEQINKQIADQQRQQLGLADALSQGDIGAAAKAAQQMQQSQMQFAADQYRSGLETSRDNQINSLTGAESGLTKDQITERQRQLEEESYYTKLQIRDVEDEIYALNQKIAVEEAKIEAKVREIRTHEDAILNFKDQIIDKEEEHIEPIEKQIAANDKKLAQYDYEVAARTEGHDIALANVAEQAKVDEALIELGLVDLAVMEGQYQQIKDNTNAMVRFGKAAAAAYSAIKTGNFSFDAKVDERIRKKKISELQADLAAQIGNIATTITSAQDKSSSSFANYQARAGKLPSMSTASFNIPTAAVSAGATNGIMGNITNNTMNNNVNVNAQGASANEVADIVIRRLDLERMKRVGDL